jgi:hypothetical protein
METAGVSFVERLIFIGGSINPPEIRMAFSFLKFLRQHFFEKVISKPPGQKRRGPEVRLNHESPRETRKASPSAPTSKSIGLAFFSVGVLRTWFVKTNQNSNRRKQIDATQTHSKTALETAAASSSNIIWRDPLNVSAIWVVGVGLKFAI